MSEVDAVDLARVRWLEDRLVVEVAKREVADLCGFSSRRATEDHWRRMGEGVREGYMRRARSVLVTGEPEPTPAFSMAQIAAAVGVGAADTPEDDTIAFYTSENGWTWVDHDVWCPSCGALIDRISGRWRPRTPALDASMKLLTRQQAAMMSRRCARCFPLAPGEGHGSAE